jgi:hypothetical protein
MNRLNFMQTIAAADAASIQVSGAPNSRLRFVHFTDIHVQKEPKATYGQQNASTTLQDRNQTSVWPVETWFSTFSK